jgi:hypothetical protein
LKATAPPRCLRISHFEGLGREVGAEAAEAAYLRVLQGPRKNRHRAREYLADARSQEDQRIHRPRLPPPRRARRMPFATSCSIFDRQRRQRRCFDRLGRHVRRSDGAGRHHLLGPRQSRLPSNHHGLAATCVQSDAGLPVPRCGRGGQRAHGQAWRGGNRLCWVRNHFRPEPSTLWLTWSLSSNLLVTAISFKDLPVLRYPRPWVDRGVVHCEPNPAWLPMARSLAGLVHGRKAIAAWAARRRP